MTSSNKLNKNSDSLIELLTAQCADLEKLLALAREETLAAEEGKFLKLMDIVSDRAALGRRLETFHQQIGELRDVLKSKGENPKQHDLANRVLELANLTLTQDRQTKLLLTESREQTAQQIKNLEKSHQATDAYLREDRKGLAYNRNF